MNSVPSWTTFLSVSHTKQLEPDDFLSLVQIQHGKQPISPSQLCDLLFRPTEFNDFSLNVRVRLWLPGLQALGLTNVPAVLRAMKKYSTFGKQADGLDGANGREEKAASNPKLKRWTDSYYSDEILFYSMAKYITSGRTPQKTQQAVELLLICIQWMELVFKSGHEVNNMLLPTNKHVVITNATTALATLLVGVIDNATIRKALSQGSAPKGTANHFSRALANFIPLLPQAPAIAERLDTFRTKTLITIEPVDKKTIAASKEMDEMLGQGPEIGPDNIEVNDLPIMRSRPGLYIYFNALLVGRPIIDDNEIIGYLHNRYQGDMQAMTVDLILAAFDVLANVTSRKESNEKEQTKFVVRSFLFNKVPLLIANLSASFFRPLTSEFCISEALTAVDTNIFPTFSSLGADSSYDNMFSESVRQDFCFACCLHGLLQESSIEGLLGDIPMQNLPPGGRATKESVLQQCLADPGKPEAFIDELENMDGNVGAVSQAITALIGQLCRNKDTSTLKSICAKLARKGAYLDVMLLFDKPYTILQPICELLDNWHYEEDQGEYQPVYEEFGSILLLVLAFVHRYDLSSVDLGISSPSSFISKLLMQGHLSKTADSVSDIENRQLDGWIRGLFDNESSGLDDELMSTCPPRDFYLLVPTLFHNIVLARSHNYLPEESLKGGLEYLVEPFLLPALIHGITWLSSHLWESRGDANAVLQILSALTSNAPNSSTTEAAHMLNSILNIVAKNLEHSLRWLQRAEPTRQDVEPLLKTLRPNMGWERRGASDHIELDSWTKSETSHSSLVINIRTTIRGLVTWALDPGTNISPTAYTHRQILVGLRILSAKRVLKIIIDEVKVHTEKESGSGSAVLDVATALICVPDSASWESGHPPLGDNNMMEVTALPLQRRMVLREALKIEAEAAAKASEEDPYYAELVVRLYRRVEAQMLNIPPQPVILTSGLTGLDTSLGGLPDMGDLSAVGGDLGQGSTMDDVLGAESDLMSGLLGGGDLGDPMGGTLDAGDLFGDSMDFS